MENCVMSRDNMLTDIAALDFMLIDLSLYLDTHPTDVCAINLFNSIQSQANMEKTNYTTNFGPLTVGSTSQTTWNWLCNPWPWDKTGGGC